MKRLNNLTFLLPLLLLAFAFLVCDTDNNPLGTLEETVKRIPDVRVISGAENATVNVRYDRQRSYFSVTLGNVDESRFVMDRYNAWCLQMDFPIGTNREYTGAKLFDSNNDKIYNKLTYIINKRPVYEQANPGLSWKEIQVAFWVILETKDMNLSSIRNKLPSSVDGFNESYVNNIINDVKTNGVDFEPNSANTILSFLEVSPEYQLVALEEGAWAYANGYDQMPRAESKEFNELVTSPSNTTKWGWYILIFDPLDEDSDIPAVDVTFKFWAGAAQNDFDKGTLIGEGAISVDLLANKLFITLNLYNNESGSFAIKELKIHITDDVGEGLPVNPGEFEYRYTYVNAIYSDNYEFDYIWTGDPLYIAIHSGEIYSVL
jgi:hypothetical protein